MGVGVGAGVGMGGGGGMGVGGRYTWGPEPDPLPKSADARPSIGVVVGLVAAGLIGLVLGGLAVAWVVDDARDPPAREPGSAAGLDPPGMLVTDESYAETQVRTNGDVIVRHWIQADEPLRRLRLVLPQVPGAEELSAKGIEVVADGALVNGPATLTGIGATYTFDKTTDVQVRYVLAGAVVRSDSAAGRALALATTLDLRYSPRPERGIRVVIAPEVLSLACSASPDAAPVPCGRAESIDQWRVELTGPRVDDRVMAQVTLELTRDNQAGVSSSSPCSMAQRVSWTRLFIWSLRRVFWTWFCTVRCDSTSRWAICL